MPSETAISVNFENGKCTHLKDFAIRGNLPAIERYEEDTQNDFAKPDHHSSHSQVPYSAALVAYDLKLLMEKPSWDEADFCLVKKWVAHCVQVDLREMEYTVLVLQVITKSSQKEQNRSCCILDLLETVRPLVLRILRHLLKGDSEMDAQMLSELCCFFHEIYRSFPVTYAGFLQEVLPILQEKHRILTNNGINVPAIVQDVLRYLDEGEGVKNPISRGLSEGMPERTVFYRKKKGQDRMPLGNFRDIPVFPEGDDMLVRNDELFLKPNIIKGSYRNVEHYLDVHFRLLREDLVGSLRDVLVYCEPHALDNQQNLIYFKGVKVLSSDCKMCGIVHTLQFNSEILNVDWSNCKKLLNGSIVCLSTDGFRKLLFGTVVNSSPDSLKKGRLQVLFDDLNYQIKPVDKTLVYSMIECPAYFEAYRYCLLKLKDMSWRNFPFQRYIVRCSVSSTGKPSYLRSEDTEYDLRCLVKNGLRESGKKFNVPVLKCDKWPSVDVLSLDNSQLGAIKWALTQEFSLIQGPPGTGKTYVGLKIVQTLLDNHKLWYEPDQSPILVVCYTNHALDQFLEGILQFSDEIARVGGGCGSTKLERCTVSYLKKLNRSNSETGYDRSCQVSMRKLKQHILELQDLLNKVRFDFRRVFDLKQFMNRQHSQSFDPKTKKWGSGWDFESVVEYWLGFKQEQYANTVDQEIKRTKEFIKNVLDVNYTGWILDGAVISLNEEIILDPSSQSHYAMAEIEETFVFDIWNMDLFQRWQLYRSWFRRCLQDKVRNLRAMTNEYNMLVRMVGENNLLQMTDAIRGAKVLGMTTTGAAKYSEIFKELRPKILIVEEAAEVFEAHVITSLSESIKHVVLIGDHQQLPPLPAVYELTRRFNLGVSLFERMIKNDMPFRQLNVQHRMRPSISKLLVPEIYVDLQNHDQVFEYEDIRGMKNNVYFFTHHEPEMPFQNGTSYANDFESDFARELCWYLRVQNYSASQVTILSFYSAQVNEIKEKLKTLQNIGEVRVCTVDNFQGEESDIIILSFVRSNREARIGFLKDPTRICVALSRARMGLYAIGNFDIMARSSTLWAKTAKKLATTGSIGNALRIYCQKHPDIMEDIKAPSDFREKSPAGGCFQRCTFTYNCGHPCLSFCHPLSDEMHSKQLPCQWLCENRCHFGHPCGRRCHVGSPCEPCEFITNKVCTGCNDSFCVPCWKDASGDCPSHDNVDALP